MNLTQLCAGLPALPQPKSPTISYQLLMFLS